jgi:hypothetical protein
MAWKDISVPERERLLKLYEMGDMDALAVYADGVGMKQASLERRLRDHRYYKTLYLGNAALQVDMKPSPSKQYVDFEKLDGDDFIIISDIEIPDHNPLYLLLALYTAMAHGIKKLVIAGDLIATDQKGLVAWVATWVEQGELNYEDAIALVVSILREFEKWFDIIIVIEGNHDDRVARATQGQVHFGMLLNGTTKVVYSRYSYLHLNTSRGLVWIVHPSNFSGDPITLGQKLYSNHSPKGHWIVAHCHRRQDGWSPDGEYEIHALGTGRDPERTKYKATKINTHKAWDTSFLMIKGGYHYPLDLKSTNWCEVLGSLYTVFRQHPLITAANL